MWKCNILFGISGSISAYKVAGVVSQLIKWGHRVRIAATESSLEFVGASTWEGLTGEPPLISSFESGRQMSHIHWQREADLIVFAPATAHTLNSMAAGAGSSVLLDLYLAHDFKKPFLVAPAMNTAMWMHPATVQSVRTLEREGLTFVGPDQGSLACGEEGAGRLIEPEALTAAILKHLPRPVTSRSFLITYGGTQESIDDVRTLSNFSTGKSGALLAEELIRKGHQVEVLRSASAPRALGVQREGIFTDAASLSEQISLRLSGHVDTWIQMAAVADFTVERAKERKISSEKDELNLKLKKAPKLIKTLGDKRAKSCALVAFKLTSHATTSEVKEAVSKLARSAGVDYIVHNDLKDHLKGEPAYSLYNQQGEALGNFTGVASLATALESLGPQLPSHLEKSHDLMP